MATQCNEVSIKDPSTVSVLLENFNFHTEMSSNVALNTLKYRSLNFDLQSCKT